MDACWLQDAAANEILDAVRDGIARAMLQPCAHFCPSWARSVFHFFGLRAMCSMSVTDRLHWQLRFEETVLKSQTLIQSPPLGGRLARRGPKATQSGLLQRVAIRAGSCPESRAPQHMVHLVTAAEPGAATLLAPVVETLSERCPSVVSIVRSDAAAAAAQPQQRRRRDREPRRKPTRGSDTEVGATESATCHRAMVAGRALP